MGRSRLDGDSTLLPDSMSWDITFNIHANSRTMTDGPPYCTPQPSRDISNCQLVPTVPFFGINFDFCFAGMDDFAGSLFHSHMRGMFCFDLPRHWPGFDCGTKKSMQKSFHSKQFYDSDMSFAHLSIEHHGSGFLANSGTDRSLCPRLSTLPMV